MSKWFCLAALLVLLHGSLAAWAADETSSRYKGLMCPLPASQKTWAVLDRDGAGQQVPRYLSSLAAGESATGVIASAAFRISVDAITLTICGHDGPGGGEKRNFAALADAKTGDVLRQTPAPGNDALQQRSWNVADLRGREVRVELRDGHSGGAYAWLGVGQIDAGDALRVDFRDGLPDGWVQRANAAAEPPAEVLRGPVPFLRWPSVYTLVPASGFCEIACGFAAERVFLLGGTVAAGKPLEVYGYVDIVYRNGQKEIYPLMVGYTLDAAGKELSTSKAQFLHRSADPFQHYLVLGPRPEVIEKIVLRPEPGQDGRARITAVTCQTSAGAKNVVSLPAAAPRVDEEAWIRAHTITAKSPDMDQITAEIRRAHKLQ